MPVSLQNCGSRSSATSSFSPTRARDPSATLHRRAPARSRSPARRRSARLPGMVQGVVVQITTDAPCSSGTGALHDREAHPDRRAGVVVVLDLGLGQRGLLHRRPHHRAQAAIQRAVQQELADLARRSPPPRRGPWWRSGRAKSPSTPRRRNSAACTSIQCSRVGAALGAEIQHRHRVLVAAFLRGTRSSIFHSIGRPWQSQPGM